MCRVLRRRVAGHPRHTEGRGCRRPTVREDTGDAYRYRSGSRSHSFDTWSFVTKCLAAGGTGGCGADRCGGDGASEVWGIVAAEKNKRNQYAVARSLGRAPDNPRHGAVPGRQESAWAVCRWDRSAFCHASGYAHDGGSHAFP